MSTLCTLQNLTLTFPLKTIFKDVTFTLHEGDKIGVLGLNGHGKSSLFKVMMGLTTPDTTVPPFIYDRNKDLTIFYVPQELPHTADYSVEDYFYHFYPEFNRRRLRLNHIAHALGEGAGDMDKLLAEQAHLFEEQEQHHDERIYNQYLSYLKSFGVNGWERTVVGLSGGEQRKVALALGLSCPHQVILWDEPTNHLDLETILIFEEELQNSRKTFLIISHDRGLLNNVVDRILHIQAGKLKSFQGTYEAYLLYLQEEQKRREKELDKLSNLQRRETAWISRGAKARRTKSKKRIEDYGTLNQTIANLKSQAHKQVSMQLQASGKKSKILFEAQNLTQKFGDRTLFNGLNFSVAKGDKIALMGRNGAGKSTLLKILLGEIVASGGTVRKLDTLTVGYFSQKRETLQDNMTPWELIGEGIDFVISNTGDKRHVASYLESFLFRSEELKRPIHTFSGGEKNRLQLAQFMKHAQDIWIFDEPTNDLDLETIGVLEEELRNYPGALIVVGHDRAFIENATDKCWVLHEGKLEMFDGGYEQAEMFMEAVALEEELKKKAPLQAPVVAAPTPPAIPKEKLSNKEKQRLQVIDKEVEAATTKVEGLRGKLSVYDYASASTESKSALEKLQQELSTAEHKLMELEEEWLLLQDKI